MLGKVWEWLARRRDETSMGVKDARLGKLEMNDILSGELMSDALTRILLIDRRGTVRDDDFTSQYFEAHPEREGERCKDESPTAVQ